jgi:regulator of sigma E protease
MPEGLAALFWGVLTFSLLVVIHEGGHFLTARMFGVKVHEFMVGLPGPALRFHAPKTTYGITAIPLGGYVRIAGMEPGPEDPELGAVLSQTTRMGTANASDISLALGIEEKDADRLLMTLADWDALEAVEGDAYRYRSKFSAEQADDPDGLLDKARASTYRALSTWKRVVVLSAGVVLNLLTAVLVFTVVLSAWGYQEPTTTIANVAEGSAAEQAGIMSGDTLVAIGDRTIDAWADVPAAVAVNEAGDTVSVVVERAGEQLTFQAQLGEHPTEGTPMLGVTPQAREVRMSVPAALVESISYIGLTFTAIMALFNPATFAESVQGATSIIGISYIAAEAVQTSPLQYASLVALISLSLGIINILPIPPLDGGKIAVELVERFAGRRIPRKVSLGMSAAGAILLFSLIFYLMYADIMRFVIN